jgi:hypothetical protein
MHVSSRASDSRQQTAGTRQYTAESREQKAGSRQQSVHLQARPGVQGVPLSADQEGPAALRGEEGVPGGLGGLGGLMNSMG